MEKKADKVTILLFFACFCIIKYSRFIANLPSSEPAIKFNSQFVAFGAEAEIDQKV